MIKNLRERVTGNRFGMSESGQVAVIFALSLIPIVAIAGFAIDFQNTTTRKVQVQAAVDTAVIAGARAMQAGKTEAEIQADMGSYINAMIDTKQNGLTCGLPIISFPEDTKDIEVNVRCSQEAIVSQVVGKDKIEFDVSASSTWGIGKLDVAFMFDVSGSMGWDNRIGHLKDAAEDALDTLLPAGGGPGTDEVRVAMVSYNDMVNAGDYFSDVTGLAPTRTYYAIDNITEWEEYTTIENKRVKESQRVCKRWNRRGTRCKKYRWEDVWVWKDVEVTEQRRVDRQVEVVSDPITSTCVWEREGLHAFDGTSPYGSSVYRGEDPPEPTDKVYGANEPIYNASEDPDNNPEGYLSAAYLRFIDNGENEGYWEDLRGLDTGTTCRSHEPIGLTRNRTQLINYIKGLTTGGGTAGHQGIAWTWALVAEEWQNIFTGSEKPLDYDEPDSIKAVILMTDGDFLHQHFDEQGNSQQQARQVCDAMKNNGGVIVYTVAFQAPAQGQEILRYCASEEDFAFTPDNGDELTQAYQAIATSISDLRIKF